MGNSNSLGYMAGAYNHLVEKKKKDAEEAYLRGLRQAQLDLQRQHIERQGKKWEWEKDEKNKALESQRLAPILKPYAPYLNREIEGKSTLEVPLPNNAMSDILSVTGMPAISLLGIPKQVSYDNFVTGDEQSELLKEQRAIDAKKQLVDYEVEKKRAMADAGLIRDYNRDPIGIRSGSGKRISNPGWTGTTLYSESGGNSSGSITAPTIKPYIPVKKFNQAFSSNPDLANALFEEAKSQYPNLSQTEWKDLATKRYNEELAQKHEAEQKQIQRQAIPKVDPTPDQKAAVYGLFLDAPAADSNALTTTPGLSNQGLQPPAHSKEEFVAPTIKRVSATQQDPTLNGMNMEDYQKEIVRRQLAQKIQPVARQQEVFNSVISIAENQLGRSLTDDERGYLAEMIFENGATDGFDLTTGTFRHPDEMLQNFGKGKSIAELLTSNPVITSYGAQNVAQAYRDAARHPIDAAKDIARWGAQSVAAPVAGSISGALNQGVQNYVKQPLDKLKLFLTGNR